MKNRPYFKKSIVELERTFNGNRDNNETLDLLLHELEFRSTQRALALKEKVLAANDERLKVTSRLTTDRNPDHDTDRQQSSWQPEEPPQVPELKRQVSKPKPKPPVTNDPQNILRTWTALEVLSPQGYRRETDLVAGDKSRIARFEEQDLPWEIGERSRPKKRLYYELILGAIALAPAVESLLRLYADSRPDKPTMRGFCPIASILLDKEGRPLEEDGTFAISSFAWGVPIALHCDLKTLADWPQQERSLIASFRKRLFRRDDDDDILPLTKAHIIELFDHLLGALSLHEQEVKPPYFTLRRYEFFASKTPPEPGLLNSFFLEDLAEARVYAGSNNLPNALRHYLGVEKPPHKTDLLKNDAGLQHLLQPALTPSGRWLGSGRFPLALLQQAAVNAATPTLMKTGILAVNGPPGTGKTTLLRDIVAARIVERAETMSRFRQPADAFIPTSQSFQRSGAKITLHKLDERLKGFEMVVASSNNKAVENVSAELPALDAVADDAPGMRYFKTISDNVLDRETWGIVAAVLGNASNRYLFSQGFWRDDENGLSTYLNHASGIPQVVSEPQREGPPLKRNRKIVDRENPPANVRVAIARWEKARTSFLRVLKAAREAQAALQELYVQLVRLVTISVELNNLRAQQSVLQEEAEALKNRLAVAQEAVHATNETMTASHRLRDEHFAARPSIFSRIFRTRHFRTWRAKFKGFEIKATQCENKHSACKRKFDDLHVDFSAKRNQIEQLKTKVETLESEKHQLAAQTEQHRKDLNVRVPDASFFACAHEDIQTAGVWFDKATHILRDDVFEAAIHLRRAFIDCAADPLRQNLSVFVEAFGTRSLGTPQKDALIADLWASFFLVVPVVSTTFASVHRMFSRLAPEALGWLLVDEAGQAVPQAVIGAMMRTKRSVVVGDPLQIEPVVTLPNSLTEEICAFFGVDSLKYNAPEASVQTVADAASMYCARFPIGSGHRDVGAPLLVHRRCDSPMLVRRRRDVPPFGIIAYEPITLLSPIITY